MPKKQKWAVISVFLLGVLVVITSSMSPFSPLISSPLTMYPVIRAIYSYRNEQMVTCTVSMIETAIAIIASCLPVLRTLVFGSHSRTGTYSGHRGYELSHSGVHTGGVSKQHTTVSTSQSQVDRGVDDISFNDSEDGLVKDTAPISGPGIASDMSISCIRIMRKAQNFCGACEALTRRVCIPATRFSLLKLG
jgi:hypothetical protein